MSSFIHGILPSCAAILLGGGVVWAATDGLRAFTEESARRLQVAEHRPAIPPLMLEDMNGRQLRIGGAAQSKPAITLVEFIYTTCPTICQSAGAEFARLRDRLREAGLGDRVRLVSVSFDPKRDTPDRLRDYAENHDADGVVWTVARSQPEALERMKRSFGLRVIADDMGGFQHNAAVHLIDRSGRLAGIFNSDGVEDVFRAIQNRL